MENQADKDEDYYTEFGCDNFISAADASDVRLRGFIEIHQKKSRNTHLINVNHITEVTDNKIFTDDFAPFIIDFPYFDCVEDYDEIKALIAKAVRDK